MPAMYGLRAIHSSRPTKTPAGIRVAGVIYIPLPEGLHKPRPNGGDGMLDTLAVAARGESTVTWMVHRPDLRGENSDAVIDVPDPTGGE